MFFHLSRHLLDRDRPVFVGVHFLEEKLDFFLGDIGVNVPQKVTKLRKIQLILVLNPHTVQQLHQVNILRIDLETQLSHHHL